MLNIRACYELYQGPRSNPSKTLRVLLKKSESGMDPATASDVNTMEIIENLFDPMLRYDYLARPVQLKPNTLTAMPEIDKLGTTYTFHLRPGIYFTPDNAFGGKPRELTAGDYVYSLKRLYDPAIKSPWRFVLEGKIVGDDIFKKQPASAKPQRDIAIAGLTAIDRYTLRIRLNHPDHNFLFDLAMPATGGRARGDRGIPTCIRRPSGRHRSLLAERAAA
jgi:ABC-type transport system substrate-binding protein